MIQTQQFEGFPVFGDNSTKSQPEAAVYSNGFAPADVLPAEYYNWLTNKASVGITDLNRGVTSVENELNNVVTAGGEEPTEETSNQVITAIKYLIAQAKNEAILAAHPVGSLYWSSKNTNPSQLFGGTWTQIKDKFILAAGDTYNNGATGGAATVTLTVNQIPSHTHTGPSHSHSFTPAGTISGGEHTHTGPSHTHSFTPAGTITGGEHTHTGPSHSHSFTPSGTITGGEHTHTGPSHSHSFTPSGTIAVSKHTHTLNNHTHSFSFSYSHSHGMIHYHDRGTMEIEGKFAGIPAGSGWSYSGAFADSVTTSSSDNTWGTSDAKRVRVVLTASKGWTGRTSRGYATQTTTDPTLKDKTDSDSVTISGTTGTATGNTGETTPTATFTGTASNTGANGTGATGKTTPTMTFTGTAGSTGAAGTGTTGKATPTMTFAGSAGTTGASGTGVTGKATPSMTFTGTAGTTGASGTGVTGATGDGSAHNNMPPYVVKYCWERTA